MTKSILDIIESESPKELNTYDIFVKDHVKEIIRSIRHDMTINHGTEELENALMILENLTSTLYYMMVFGLLSNIVYYNLYHYIVCVKFYFNHTYKIGD